MDEELLQMLANVMSALAHPLRLKIVEKLRDGSCCVCKIIPHVGGEQSNVSHHLAILRKAGIVRSEKKGLEVWYAVTSQNYFKIIDLLQECVAEDLNRAQSMLEVLEKIRTGEE